jgi:hypothetical protein
MNVLDESKRSDPLSHYRVHAADGSSSGRQWVLMHNHALHTRMHDAFVEFITTPHSFGRRAWNPRFEDDGSARALFDDIVRIEALHEALHGGNKEELLPFFESRFCRGDPMSGFFENSVQVHHLFAALLEAFVGEKCVIERCGTVFHIAHRRSVPGVHGRVLTHTYVKLLREGAFVWNVGHADVTDWDSERDSRGFRTWTYIGE